MVPSPWWDNKQTSEWRGIGPGWHAVLYSRCTLMGSPTRNIVYCNINDLSISFPPICYFLLCCLVKKTYNRGILYLRCPGTLKGTITTDEKKLCTVNVKDKRGNFLSLVSPHFISCNSRFKLPAHCTVLLTQTGRSEECKCIVPSKHIHLFSTVGIGGE